MSRYLIGIDLGTTNSALAYIDLQHASRGGRIDVHPFPVPQLAAPGEIKERPLLPSFLYSPGAHDLPQVRHALAGRRRNRRAVRTPQKHGTPHHRDAGAGGIVRVNYVLHPKLGGTP
jgi:molecular chaperone DnaK (HSP70)